MRAPNAPPLSHFICIFLWSYYCALNQLWNPHWYLNSISSKKVWIWLQRHFAYIFDIFGKMLMGLQPSFYLSGFFLNVGVTSASFKSKGKLKFSTQKFVFIKISGNFCWDIIFLCCFCGLQFLDFLKNFFIRNSIKSKSLPFFFIELDTQLISNLVNII